jgi:dihydrofolate reductase
MPKLIVFNHVSLDGYFVDANNQMSWAKNHVDDEWNSFMTENAKGGGVLLFGRVTYEMMASYWPTEAALQSMPEVAKQMNNLPKVVFSRTLDKATWNNTKLIKNNLIDEVKKMKAGDGDGMALMGSGTIVSQLTQANLIDEFQVVVNPVILGKGRTMFEGDDVKQLRLTNTRTFKNGNVFVCYEPKS